MPVALENLSSLSRSTRSFGGRETVFRRPELRPSARRGQRHSEKTGRTPGARDSQRGRPDPSGSNGQEQAPQHPETIKAIIHDIQAGWENADGTPFKKHFLDFEGARYVESGGQNESLKDLVEHHVEPEGDALQGLTLTFRNIEVHFEGLFAWAIADVAVKAIIKSDGRKIDKRGYETFLFRYVDDSWKVVHTHSSTRSVKK